MNAWDNNEDLGGPSSEEVRAHDEWFDAKDDAKQADYEENEQLFLVTAYDGDDLVEEEACNGTIERDAYVSELVALGYRVEWEELDEPEYDE